MSKLGLRIAQDNLEPGQQYNVRRRSGIATVKFIGADTNGIEVEIIDGGFVAPGLRQKKGETVTLPLDGSDWYEPQI